MGGDYFTGAVLAAALTKLVLRFDENSQDKVTCHTLRAEVCIGFLVCPCAVLNITKSMLIMTSIIRVGQSKFVTTQVDEDSNERIMNCIQTLSELKTEPSVHEVFLDDTKTAFSKMLGAQEVCVSFLNQKDVFQFFEIKKRAAEKKEAETKKEAIVQVDDLLSFRQFSKRMPDEAIDVSPIL